MIKCSVMHYDAIRCMTAPGIISFPDHTVLYGVGRCCSWAAVLPGLVSCYWLLCTSQQASQTSKIIVYQHCYAHAMKHVAEHILDSVRQPICETAQSSMRQHQHLTPAHMPDYPDWCCLSIVCYEAVCSAFLTALSTLSLPARMSVIH